MLLITSVTLDPYWNLAVEDHLLDLAGVQGPTLFLWQSHDTVVVGKNQNPWRECNRAYLEAHEIQLARRISGGGTVYHDVGNLNYAFFCGRDRYEQDEVYSTLASGLLRLGVPVERLGKSNLAVDGRKISGNAFCYRRNSVMQHGTLLVNTHLDRLRHSLSPPPLTFDTHAVRSEPAEVVNLSELNPLWNLEQVGLAVAAGFEQTYGPVDTRLCSDDLHPDRMQELHQQFCSREWRLGKTPRFQVRLQFNQMDVHLEVRHGRISRVTVESGGGLRWAGCIGTWFAADDIAAAVSDPLHTDTVRHGLRDLGL